MSPIPTALITAGSAGLGAATAKLFARNGYSVVINYANNSDRAEALVKELESLSSAASSSSSTEGSQRQHFHAIKADLTSRTETAALVKSAADALGGRLDVLFSNGGWTRLRNIADLDDNVDEDDWDRCFNMNVKSHLFLMHAARPYLDEAEGAFITTASLAGSPNLMILIKPLPPFAFILPNIVWTQPRISSEPKNKSKQRLSRPHVD
ncbi:short chain dehydrogenase, partial [Colletotrichum fioriniae PJ7]